VDFRDLLGDIDRQTEPGNARFPSPLVLSSSRTRRRPDPLSRLGIGRHRL